MLSNYWSRTKLLKSRTNINDIKIKTNDKGDGNINYPDLIVHIIYMHWNIPMYPINMYNC
jgi:hypothetical protein